MITLELHNLKTATKKFMNFIKAARAISIQKITIIFLIMIGYKVLTIFFTIESKSLYFFNLQNDLLVLINQRLHLATRYIWSSRICILRNSVN